jgi:hypothetical protein
VNTSLAERLSRILSLPLPPQKRQPAQRAALTFAQDMGWKSQLGTGGRTEYTGFFQACSLRWKGFIYQELDNTLDFYILNPPVGLLRHTDYAGCFHARNDGWYLITFKPYAKPINVDSGISAIQRALAESIRAGLNRARGARA